ncbi:MAG: autotransporter outer membrane beta-barrel domain-containing protein, partial [Gammaproteobacteria bacterium]
NTGGFLFIVEEITLQRVKDYLTSPRGMFVICTNALLIGETIRMLSAIKRFSVGLTASIFCVGTAFAYLEQFNTAVELLPYTGSPGDGSVQYVNFNVSSTGLFKITAEGEDYCATDPYEGCTITTGRGSEFNDDPEIVLFKSSVLSENYVADDDDSGYLSGLAGLDSQIGDGGGYINLSYQDINGDLQLTPGTYVLAVSEYPFNATDAIAGTSSSVDDPNTLILVTVFSDGAVAVCADNCNYYAGSSGETVNPPSSGATEVVNTAETVALTVTPIVTTLSGRTFAVFRSGKTGIGTLKPFEKTGAMYEGEIGLNAGDGMILLGYWGGYSYTRLENDFSRTRYDGDRHMFLGGIDFSPKESLIMGVALGYENNDLDTDFNFGEADADGWTVAPYFGVVIDDVWNLDVSFGYSNIDTDQDRSFGTITSDVDTDRYFASANLSAFTQVDNWLLIGRFGAMHAINKDDSYTEKGVGGNTVDSNTTRLTQLNIGGEASYLMGDFEPFIGATYSYDLMSDKLELSPGKQPDYDRYDVLINAGFRYYSKDNLSSSLDYSKRFGRSDYDEDTLSLNLRWDF